MCEHEGQFKIGDTVYSKAAPTIKLIVKRYVRRVYYCRFVDEPDKKDISLFEREIVQ